MYGLYWAHLVAPVFLLSNVAWFWYTNRTFRAGGEVLFWFAAIWLTIAVVVHFVHRNPQRLGDRIASGAFRLYGTVAYSTLAFLFLSEIVLRIVTPSGPFIRPPGITAISEADETTLPGIPTGRKSFTVNGLGLRGPNLPPANSNVFKVITIGGSTTESFYLDDSEAWPQALMTNLNASQATYRVWVANAGVSGHTAVQHLAVMQEIPIASRADLLIFLAGINDLQATLAFRGAPTQEDLEKVTSEQVAQWQGRVERRQGTPLFARALLYQRVLKPLIELQSADRLTDHAAGWYVPNRRLRSDARIVPLPDLSAGVAEYRARLLRLFTECRNRHRRCLFLTQPTMWRDDLPPELERLLWAGWIGPRRKPDGYASTADLARAMARYNNALMDACRQDGAECLDLAALIPKDTSALYDDCHFNARGARLVADTLTRYLLAHPPLSGT